MSLLKSVWMRLGLDTIDDLAVAAEMEALELEWPFRTSFSRA
jgi:hypothetical protein